MKTTCHICQTAEPDKDIRQVCGRPVCVHCLDAYTPMEMAQHRLLECDDVDITEPAPELQTGLFGGRSKTAGKRSQPQEDQTRLFADGQPYIEDTNENLLF